MAEHLLTQVEFEGKAHIDDRTLRRLLKAGSASNRTWAEVAAAMGLTTKQLRATGHETDKLKSP
jgi:hypothetical protein